MTLDWIEDFLPEGFFRRKMFGGLAYYFNEKLIVTCFESEGYRTHKNKKYDFEIWNGVMFPVELPLQPEVLERFPFLIQHPILKKWLYLPLETEDFEELVRQVLKEIRRHNPSFGTIPKVKKSSATKKSSKQKSEKIDMRRPQMFSEDRPENVLKKARKISDLKNLGPESEKAFAKAGIKTAQQFIKLGWKKTMVKLCKADAKNNHSIFAYAVIGALKNVMWNQIPEEDKQEARALMKALRKK